jgi:hypothetical protein
VRWRFPADSNVLVERRWQILEANDLKKCEQVQEVVEVDREVSELKNPEAARARAEVREPGCPSDR